VAWGGASDFFGVKPDMICLAKSIGGGTPLGAFGASRAVMDLISQRKVFHGGTYNTNRISMAAGLATFREVLTRENLCLRRQAQQETHGRLPQHRGQVGIASVCGQRGSEWSADAVSERDSQLPRLDHD